jgi:DsbC/DsbD-like thiol-disulfide interchange protein
MCRATRDRFSSIAVMVALCFAVPSAHAQDASAWDTDLHSATRLIAGAASTTTDAAPVRAGIEIRLDPGWKTYWRYPGDSGVPPTFDFAGSLNVKSVTVLWPAPHRFPDGAGGTSIGYKGDFVLPVHIVPQDASRPATLKAKINYAVCERQCVPVDAKAELTVPGKASAEDAELAAAEAHVPKHAALGAGSASGLSIRSFHREPGGAHEHVVVDVAAPDGAPLDLFVEGPTPEWGLPLPEPLPNSGKTHRFVFDLDGLPPGAHADGAILTFTAVSGDDAIEVSSHLD